MDNNIRPVIAHESDCELESWNDDTRGYVEWRTLISGDRTPTHALTSGVAVLPVGRTTVFRMHRHSQPEMYYVLEGHGAIRIDRDENAVGPGTTVFIPGDVPHCLVNTGDVPLRLLYVLAADSFSDVRYVFP